MPQTTHPLFDDVARLFTDAAGMAQGVRREAETALRTQAERFLSTMDVVTREEFEAMRTLAATARDEAERLSVRLTAMEARLAALETAAPTAPPSVGLADV